MGLKGGTPDQTMLGVSGLAQSARHRDRPLVRTLQLGGGTAEPRLHRERPLILVSLRRHRGAQHQQPKPLPIRTASAALDHCVERPSVHDRVDQLRQLHLVDRHVANGLGEHVAQVAVLERPARLRAVAMNRFVRAIGCVFGIVTMIMR